MRASNFKQRPGIYDNVPHEDVTVEDLKRYIADQRAAGETDAKIAQRLDVRPATIARIMV